VARTHSLALAPLTSPKVAPQATRSLASLSTSWRYSPSGSRDLRLDFLRGFAVFAMAVDHIGGASPFHLLSGGNRFFVSAAEAFVFISGVTVGMVYARMAVVGMGRICVRAFGRAWTLYTIAVWLGLAAAAGSAVFGLPKGAAFAAEPGRFVLDVVFLRRTFYLVDVMLLYAFLMCLVPVMMMLLRRGQGWLLLAGSVTLWGAYQVWPERVVLPWEITDYRTFPLAAWQVLFVPAVVLGYHREAVGRAFAKIPRPALPGGWLLPVATAFGLMVWLHLTNAAVVDYWRGPGAGARLLDAWFNKAALPAPRLLACAVVFTFGWQLATRYWIPLVRTAGGFFLTFGRSALYAFSAHVVAASVLEIIIFRWRGEVPLTSPESFLVQGMMLAAVWGATRTRFLKREVQWLGRPPVHLALVPGQGLNWQPAGALFAIGLLFLTASVDFGRESTEIAAAGASSARRTTYNNPVTTVTPPRASVKQWTQATADEVVNPVAAPSFFRTQGDLSDQQMFSPALNQTVPYAIYLPAEYFTHPTSRFPVLYMLHGAGGRYTEWSTYGLTDIASNMIASGEIRTMIIVMPEGGRGYWADGFSGLGEDWGTYVVNDLVPHIDATYRTLPAASERAIGGLSRGGFGALYLAFTHPDVFGIVGAHSPSLPDYGGIDYPVITAAQFDAYDPIALAARLDPADAPKIRIDIGIADDWRPAVEMLDRTLTAHGIPHTLVEGEGGHLQEYWTANSEDYLRYYAGAFGPTN
jgi:S-formylglutathione hydrolase FrmB